VNYLNSLTELTFIHTFHGIPFWDDKYDDITASARLKNTLEKSLPELEWKVGNADYVYLTIQPSDDMYLSGAFKEIKEKAAELLNSGTNNYSIGYRQGYIMNYATKEIAEYSTRGWTTDHISTYHTDTIPPFFTILFTKDNFLNPEGHYVHIGPYKSHEQIAQLTWYHELEGRGFIVGCHGENISTTYNHRYKGRTLTKEETEKLLIDTNTFHSPPLKIRLSLRMGIRKVVNRFPFMNIIKRIYYKIPGKWRII
jgi:hypothetical protein